MCQRLGFAVSVQAAKRKRTKEGWRFMCSSGAGPGLAGGPRKKMLCLMHDFVAFRRWSEMGALRRPPQKEGPEKRRGRRAIAG